MDLHVGESATRTGVGAFTLMSDTPQRKDDDRAGGSSSATFCFVPA